jgi:hypothetical protein
MSYRKSLRQPYTGPPTRENFAEAIEVSSPQIRGLARQIFSDLDPVNFGISWWKTHPNLSTPHRIFISDYLANVVDQVADGLVNAKLHLFELTEALEEGSRQASNSVKLSKSGQMLFDSPHARNAEDELAKYHVDLHLNGFLCAIGSVLDCLGATIIGVTGLPAKIIRADFLKVKNLLVTFPLPPVVKRPVGSRDVGTAGRGCW